MFDFLKTLGEGVIYTLLSTFILIVVLLHMVYCIVLFFVMFIKRIIMFFQGKDMSLDSELDKAAKIHIQMHKKNILSKEQQEAIPSPQPPQQPTFVQPIIIQTGPDGVRATSAQNQSSHHEDFYYRKHSQFDKNKEPLDYSTKELSYDELLKEEKKDGDHYDRP